MNTLLTPDLDSLRETYEWLNHEAHGVTEVRIIEQGRRVPPLVAYVDNADAFVEIAAKNNDRANVYVGIQPRPRRLFSRAPNRAAHGIHGANIDDIEVVCNTVIDIDPVRAKDTASTAGELAVAIRAAELGAARLVLAGYEQPQLMLSGNGVQLWIAFAAVELNETVRATVQENLRLFEAEVRAWVQNDRVKVDSIHDFPRIIKAIGSISRKGEHTDERPHRLSTPLGGSSLEPRIECEETRARLLRPLPVAVESRKQAALPIFQPGAVTPGLLRSSREASGKARRDPVTLTYDYRRPVEMCSPIERLWNEGYTDRSLAIFDMILWFLFRGLTEQETEDLIIAYDAQGLRKLQNRDAHRYVQREIAKAIATSGGREHVRPPCHSLQQIGYCPVNKEPLARCELYDVVFTVEHAVSRIPKDIGPEALPYRLKPVVRAMLDKPVEVQDAQVRLISGRFGVTEERIRGWLTDAVVERAFDSEGETPVASPEAGPASAATSETTEAKPEDDGPKRPVLDGEIVEDACCYLVINGKRELVISSFTLTPRVRIEMPDDVVFQCSAFCDNGMTIDNIQIPRSAFRSKRHLLDSLKSEHMQWTGTDNNVQGLLRSIAARRTVQKTGVTTLGEVEAGGQRYWALPDRVLSARGTEKDPPIVYLKTGNPLDEKIRYDETEAASFRSVAHKFFDLILAINSPGVVLPILGWFFATPMKPRLMKAQGSFPTLWVHGTRGSGKTALLQNIFWPLFGIGDAAPFSSNPTEWALIRTLCQTNSIPVFLDEYKPQDQTRMLALHRLLREHYSGEVQSRGQRNLGVTAFRLSAPLAIAGETRPTEAAILERIVTSMPDKIELENRSDWRRNFKALRTVDLTYFISRYVSFCLAQELEENLMLASSVVENALGGMSRHVPIRVRNNLIAVALGCHLFEEFARACDYRKLPDDIGFREAVKAVTDDLIETEAGVKDPLDHFIETLGIMGTQREILYRRNYTFGRESGILCIHFPTCYDLYRAHLRRIDYRGEIVDARAMMRLIEQNFRRQGYIRFINQRVKFDEGDSRLAIWIDLAKQSLVEVANFPTSDTIQETYGQGRRFDW